ncbi:hypothetical protein [Streptomyces sp. NPDC001508]|uniref:hypothetical protein n=1 Tax=Streptomyces sp. NPDC001508 TaxID=3154656 RepID=UPI0033172798
MPKAPAAFDRLRAKVIMVVALCLPASLCLTTSANAVAGTSSGAPDWWSYTRPATYQQVVSHIGVPMRDGTLIGCDLSLPGTSSTDPAPGHFPSILSNFTPYYAIRDTFDSGTAAMFATHGYAVQNRSSPRPTATSTRRSPC